MAVDCWIEASNLNPGKSTELNRIPEGSPAQRPQTSVAVLRQWGGV